MANYPIGVTKSLGSWNFQKHSVERVTDNSAYDAAHPDSTIILAGPARRGVILPGRSGPRTLKAIGQLQALSMSSSASVLPSMGLGSGRSFYLRGKSQTQWTMQRTMLNGANLLRALMHNAVEAGVPADQLDEQAAFDSATSQFFINLDSELYYIPFGIAVVMRSKSRTLIASCYMELAIIATWGISWGAGQNIVAESVSGLADRVLPFQATDAMESPVVGRGTMDAVLGLASNVFPEPTYNRLGSFPNTGLDDPAVSMLG